jgi:hypothetical protein
LMVGMVVYGVIFIQCYGSRFCFVLMDGELSFCSKTFGDLIIGK